LAQMQVDAKCKVMMQQMTVTVPSAQSSLSTEMNDLCTFVESFWRFHVFCFES